MAAVDCGDGRDDGEPEAEALVRRALIEPLKGLKDPLSVDGTDWQPGVGDGQLAAARLGAGADPDLAAGGVVAGCVVEEVRDQTLGQRGVARDQGGLERPVQ